MKVVILAGGFGTRISEESHLKPKPMIEIGGMPILWHIMKYYSCFGHKEFIICCGYKAHVIKQYFSEYYLHRSDVTFDFTRDNHMQIHNNVAEDWKVTLIDTGLATMTGGRVKRIAPYVGGETFMLTYGDGVSNVDLDALLKEHKAQKRAVTLTAVAVSQKFGVIDIDDNGKIMQFREKSGEDGSKINGGFMVCEPELFDYLEGDGTILEQEPMRRLAASGQLGAFHHSGFWHCMDTQRDKQTLEEMLAKGNAPWVKW
jgi:glucose-1-phosphate cytidylyltransferase